MRAVWDKIGERYYETGTDQGMLYPIQSDGTFSAGVPWSGLTGVSLTPSGAESNAFYADNIKYLTLLSAEDLGGTITSYAYPTEFSECDGSAEIEEGVYVGQQARKIFGLAYRTIIGNDVKSNDYGYKLHLLYNALASPSERSYQTVNESPEPMEFSWEFTTTPVDITATLDGKKLKPTAIIEIDSRKVDVAKLEALEDVLYGSADKEPRLPLPDEVLTILGK